MATTMPMFPLGQVLFPHGVLQLRVFEWRYLEMVRHLIDTDQREFGVALIEAGFEVGGGDARYDVGCVARIVELSEDSRGRGRWVIVAIGERRIRVDRWLDDDPFPRAEVVDWPDPPAGPATADAVSALVPRVRRALGLAAELGLRVSPATADVDDDDPVAASYQLAEMVPLGTLERLSLLGSVTADARLERLDGALTEVEALLATRLAGG